MRKLLPILILLGVVAATAPSYSQLGDCYTTREELYDLIFTLQDSAAILGYNHIRVDSIGHSRGDQLGVQYPIYAVKFSDNVDVFEDEPTVLIIGHIHAEEVAGMEGVVQFMRLLLHRRNQTPYRNIINNAQVYIIPTMNPDGLEVISSGIDTSGTGQDTVWDYTWRKNGYKPLELAGDCNISPGMGGELCGVDLNRNFDLNWIFGDTLWHPTALEAYDYYRGPAPASEPETQAVRDFAELIKPTTSLVWHSSRTGNFSEQCFAAWEWGTAVETPKHPPDSLAIRSVLGDALSGYTSKTRKWPGTGSYIETFGGTHNGCTQDWFYWKLGTIQIVTETSPPEQIQPPCGGGADVSLAGLVATLVSPNEWLCRRVFNGQGNAGDAEDMDDQGAALAIYTKNAESGQAISAEWRILNTWTPLLPPWYTNEQWGRATFLPPPGPVTVLARKEGFVSDTATVGITPGPFQTQSVTLNLQPLPWHNLTIRVEDESGTAIPAKVHLISDFPMWLTVNSGETTISKPRGNYAVGIVPLTNDKIAIWKHFWMHTDTSFAFILPHGDEVMAENFDPGLADWTTGGGGDLWGLDMDTTAMVFGQGLHTNPNPAAFRPKYEANADTWIEYNDTINLDDDNAAHLAFDRRGRLEVPEDSFFVEVRVEGSNDWEVAKGYSDMELPWVRDWVKLTSWAGETIHLRFRLQTDESLQELGLHVDNVSIVSGTDLDGPETPALVPFSHKITNAYPNPFNPSTTIAYEVAAPGLVTFAIYNLLGQEVWRMNETLPSAGAYNLRWDGVSTNGAAMASGLYFIRMRTDVVHSTKKLMLLK